MRSSGIIVAVLATGLSLAACTQRSGADADGRVARNPANTGAQGAMQVGTAPAVARARFAALPDRGELLRYDAQSPVRDGADTWHRTELSERHALDAIAQGTLRVTTPEGRVLGFRYDRSIRHDESGDWSWIGYLPGEEAAQAVLTFGEGAVYGSIDQPGSSPLRIAMRGGVSWLVETDSTRLAGLASPAADPALAAGLDVAPAAIQRLRESRSAAPMESAAIAPATRSNPATPTVDIVIGYTQGFVAAQGGSSNAVTRLHSMVDAANVELANAKAAGRIRLVHALQVNYTDSSGDAAALARLTGYDPGKQDLVPPDPAFHALRAAREQYGADLVALVRPFRDPEQGGCGIAWRVGGAALPATVDGWDFFGYSVVSDGSDRNESDGSHRFCTERTLAHALGQSMSQDERDPAATMAHGDSSRDLAMRAIASFRPAIVSDTPAPLPAARHIDANGNGASDLFFFNHSTGSLVTWYMSGDARTAYATSAVPGAYHVVGTGNFSADRREDLFLADGDGNLALGISNGATFAIQALPYSSPSRAIAAGDFDGNGQADILLVDGSSGKITTWFMNNGIRKAYTSQTVPSGLRFITAGDFNADTKVDLLFESPQGSLYIAISRGTIFQMRATGLTHASGYSLRGVVDVNGDGKADILLHDPVANKLVVWYMDGATRTAYNSTASPAGAVLVADGDFDRNGVGDLGWVHPVSGQIWLSLGTGSGFTTNQLPYAFQPAAADPMDIDL